MHGKLALAAILAFGLLELGLIAFAVVPDVGPQYRAYYIDRTTGCLPREVPGTYQLGTTLVPVSGTAAGPFDDILVCGFGSSEPGGTWMMGREARLRFAIKAPRADLELRLTAVAPVDFRGPPQRLALRANGHDLGSVLFENTEMREIAIRIPSSVPLTDQGMLELELHMTYPTPLTPEDSRRRSLLLTALQLSPVADWWVRCGPRAC